MTTDRIDLAVSILFLSLLVANDIHADECATPFGNVSAGRPMMPNDAGGDSVLAGTR